MQFIQRQKTIKAFEDNYELLKQHTKHQNRKLVFCHPLSAPLGEGRATYRTLGMGL